MGDNNRNYKKDLIYVLIIAAVVVCMLVGVFAYCREGAFDILSCAATIASIVLSVVAIIYTMLEGNNSAKINQDTTNQLQQIKNEIKDLSAKMIELNSKKSELNKVLEEAVDAKSETVDKKAWLAIESLKSYLSEDLDE